VNHPEADEVVMTNERGELTEVTRGNLAVRLDGQWWTPPLSSGCLPGVERARLLDAGTLRERVLHVHDIRRAEQIAVVNSLRGWRHATMAGPTTGARSVAVRPAGPGSTP
jgi:para-aminobenzoate synthetase/4-amino-4-deoxychorismate lyase